MKDRLACGNWGAECRGDGIHIEVKAAYGSPRMRRELRDRGFPVGKARVERLMRAHDIRTRCKRRHEATTNSRHGLPVARERWGAGSFRGARPVLARGI